MIRPFSENVSSKDASQTKKAKLKKTSKHKTDENQIQWVTSTKSVIEVFEDMDVDHFKGASVDHFNKAKISNGRLLQQVQQHAVNENIYHTPGNLSNFRSANSSTFSYQLNSLLQKHGEDYFTRLSDEILLHVFKWLPKNVLAKCALVCKRWKTLSYDESLWKRIDLGKKNIKPGVIETVIGRGVVVLRLAMTDLKVPIFEDIEFKLENIGRFSKLQYLDLTMASISEASLDNLLSVCSQLKNISLEKCIVNNEILCELSANCGLEVLNMSLCTGVQLDGLLAIVNNCLRLRSLNFSWTDMCLECMDALCKNLPLSVKELNISGHRQVLSDKHVIEIVSRCPKLIELDVSDSPQLTHLSMDAISNTLHDLQGLQLSRCYNIHPSTYLGLRSLKKLQSLVIHGVLSDSALPVIRQRLKPVEINQELFSTVARPTVGIRRTSVWGIRVRD